MKGFLYILKNPAHKEGIYKIGRTARTPEKRASELSQPTSVAEPFEVIFFREFDNAVHAESVIFEKLKYFRVSKNREFFEIPLHLAIKTIDDFYISILKEKEKKYKRTISELSTVQETQASYNTNNTRAGNKRVLLDFYALYAQAADLALEAMQETLINQEIDYNDVAYGKIIVKNHPGFIISLILNDVFLETSEEFTYAHWKIDDVQIRIPKEVYLPIPHKNYKAKCVYAETFVSILRKHGVRSFFKIQKTNFDREKLYK